MVLRVDICARVLILFLIVLVQRFEEGECVCPSSFYPLAHTACLDPSPYSTLPRGVGQTDKATIVSEHNKYRATVQATDMQMMYWDDELAFVAQKLAESCNYAHDSLRAILCKYSAGQNLALGQPSWVPAIQGWYNETFNFTYGSSSNNLSNIGHYTQMMWNNTAKVGCGYSYCSNYGSAFYVCNYSPAGNVSPRISSPYTRGTKCAECPNRCTSSGLCDCGGLVCKNGGVLNIATCTCSCPSPYNGSADCNLNCTGAVDSSYCNKDASVGYPPSYCLVYSNVPLECPLMCGRCPGIMCTALQSISIANVSTTVGSTASAASTTATTTKQTMQSTLIVSTTRPVNTTQPPTLLATTLSGTTRNTTTTAVAATTLKMVNQTANNCPSPYYPATHTACLSPSQNSTSPKGVGAENKTLIVAEHNKYRASVQATDMQMMYWDDELAFVAQKLAENCTYAHDKQREILCKYSVGQNLALGYFSWAAAIQGWYNETYKFTYGSLVYNFSDIGHYTQIMWNDTAKLGCGYSYCTNYGKSIFVCNYAPAGNVSPRITSPFTRGTKCSACPNRCSSSGLCDCGGLVCKNGGVLNITTCTCNCPSPYQGSADCNLKCTGVVDQYYCNKSAPEGYPPSYCSLYGGVSLVCPLMCGTCPGTVCTVLQSISIAVTLTTAGSTTTASLSTMTSSTITTLSTTIASTTKANATTLLTPTTLNITKLTTLSTVNLKNTTIVATTTVAATTTKGNTTSVNMTSTATPTVAITTKLTTLQATSSQNTTKVATATAASTTTKLATLQTTLQSTTKVATTTVPASTTKVTATTTKATGSTCPSPYYPSNHTACSRPSPYSTAPKGVSTENKTSIISEHNRYRAMVQATDMQVMYWDDELAYIAQKMADQCSFAQDTPSDVLCKYSVGINMANGRSSWASAIQYWYSQASNFYYGYSGNVYSAVAYYTQLMWNDSAKVGCGYSYCTNYGSMFVCLYAQRGNRWSRLNYPYTRGTKCADCPNRCSSSGLCDCGGLVCKNGGVFNANNCTCSCPWPYQGSVDCNLNCTAIEDPSYCNLPDCGYVPSDCIYSNVPAECPLMCGLCPVSKCLTLQSSSIAVATTTSSTASTKATTATVTTPKSTVPTATTTKVTSPTTATPTATTVKDTSGPTITTVKQTTNKV